MKGKLVHLNIVKQTKTSNLASLHPEVEAGKHLKKIIWRQHACLLAEVNSSATDSFIYFAAPPGANARSNLALWKPVSLLSKAK